MAMLEVTIEAATEFIEACKLARIPVFENGLAKMQDGRPVSLTYATRGNMSDLQWAQAVLANDVAMRLMQYRCQAENVKVNEALRNARADGLSREATKAAVDAARVAANTANARHRRDVIAMRGKIAFK